jgi:hypothetical protein
MASRWVRTEVASARAKELDQQRRVLCPISIVPFTDIRQWRQCDADIGDDSAKEIREYYIPDFTRWTEHDSYQREFTK